jgi:hypothetical protein
VSADHSYDVALSYLREEHADDARELATRLRKAGYSVFFDEFEEAEMWGQILEEKLESIYRDEARFCVMFVSAAYIARPWTRHERRVAIARAVRETGYVLPIRYDDSDIPGLPDGVVYRDRRKDSLDTILGHLVKKLGPPRVPQATPAAAIQVFPADYVGVVVEKDKASRPILNIRCHVLNAGRETATLSRLEARLEDPDGSSIRMPWNLFYSGILLMLPDSPPEPVTLQRDQSRIIGIQFSAPSSIGAYAWSTGTYRLGFRGWLTGGSTSPDVESWVRLDVDPATVDWWRHWTRATEQEWRDVGDPHNAVAIPLMPLPAV